MCYNVTKIKMNTEQKVVLGICIVGILIIASVFAGILKPKQDKIQLNGFTISSEDYKAIQNYAEKNNFGKTKVCNLEIEKCSLLIRLP